MKNALVKTTTAIACLTVCLLWLAGCVHEPKSPDELEIKGDVLEISQPLDLPLSVRVIPSHVKIRFSKNGLLKLHSRQQLEILGNLEAPKEQKIFEIPEDASVSGFQSEFVSPKWWGAQGDGKTNDTTAFQKASQILQARGGGHLLIPQGKYIVGGQIHDPNSTKPFKVLAREIMSFKNLTKPLLIEGEGSVQLRLESGLKFGSFDPMTGLAFSPKGRFLDREYASEVGAMIDVLKGQEVQIRNLELDGNLESLTLGGSFGDQGRQLNACGVRIYNVHKMTLQNLYIHDHGLDGILMGFLGLTEKSEAHPHLVENVVSEFNARQGISVVGGNDVTIRNSKFNHTGKRKFHSSPGAGVDIEAEKAINRNVVMDHIEAIDNTGVGIVADSGDSADITIRNSRVVGTTRYSLWLRKPRIRIENSHVTGTAVNLYNKGSDAFVARNTVFDDIDYVTSDGKNLGAFRTSAVIEMDHSGGDVLFDQSTIIGTKVRPLWMDNGSIKDSTVIVKKSDFKPGDFAVLVRETNLENVKFKFEPEGEAKAPALPWYIASGSCENKDTVKRSHVEIVSSVKGGNFLNWCSSKGRSGLVFP